MKKTMTLLLCLALLAISFVGCKSNENKSNSKSGSKSSSEVNITTKTVKTGYAVISSASKSKDATTAEGLAEADTTFVAVMVDNDGKIVKCVIDAIQTKVNFTNAGKITTPKDTMVKTKNELGTEYGLKKASGIGKEWNEQAAAFANYVVGKTVAEVKGIAINATGAPSSSELSSSVTISVGGFISAIEKAVANAKELGAKADDKLGIGAVTNISKSTDATAAAEGLAQAYSTYAVSTFDVTNKITSCIFDGSQTNINFSTKGKITSNIAATYQTKNELGFDYGMKKASSIGKEWFEEADAFAKYVVGKSVNDIKGITVNEKSEPTDTELKSSVTISVGDFISTLEKAKNTAK